MEFNISAPSELAAVVNDMVSYADGRKIWVFEGSMGAGKTTCIKAICKKFEVIDETSSPTFSLVNVYRTAQNDELYHFDFYRIEQQMEAVDIGCDEYFYSGNYCFIEWPERIPDLIPEHYLKISIKLDNENRRIISLTKDD